MSQPPYANAVILPKSATPPPQIPPMQQMSAEEHHRIFGEIKKAMIRSSTKPQGQRNFGVRLQSNLAPHQYDAQFRWTSDTSAVVVWNRNDLPRDQRMVAVTILLTRHDQVVEERVVRQVQNGNAASAAFDSGAFDALAGSVDPIAAHFLIRASLITDSMFQAISSIVATGFFDQFGMIDLPKTSQLRFNMMNFLPDDQVAKAQYRKLMLPPDQMEEMFKEIRGGMNEADILGFKIVMELDGEPTTMFFRWFGSTAATIFWTLEGHDAVIKHIYGVSVLTTRLDLDDDKAALAYAKTAKLVEKLNPQAFETVANKKEPVIATFFADHESASHPPLLTMIEVAGAAFFNQFGMGGS